MRYLPGISLCVLALAHGLAAQAVAPDLAALTATESGVKYPLPAIVEAISGHQVAPWRGQEQEALRAAGSALVEQTQTSPIVSGRVNEAGLAVENLLEKSLAAQGFSVDTPRTQSGRRQSAGYPDLVARKGGETFYLEVKAFSAATRHSSQRSFYLSPSDDPKITEEAIHLLYGFELEALPEDEYRVTGFELVDLSTLECEVKIEFNASNRDLYGQE